MRRAILLLLLGCGALWNGGCSTNEGQGGTSDEHLTPGMTNLQSDTGENLLPSTGGDNTSNPRRPVTTE